MLLAPRLATTTRQHTDRQRAYTPLNMQWAALRPPWSCLHLWCHWCHWTAANRDGVSSPKVSIRRPVHYRPAAAPATGCSEGVIAPAACPATRSALSAAKKPQSRPQLTTCRPAGDGAAGCVCSSRPQVVRRRHGISGWHSHQRVTTDLRAAGAAAAPPRRAPREPGLYVFVHEGQDVTNKGIDHVRGTAVRFSNSGA